MWKYSKKLMDHFMNPRNTGQLSDPDGHSEVGSPGCGDAMTLDIRVNDEERIIDIKSMTFGCAGAIAASSALTVQAMGKTLKEALEISNDQIVEFLGGMPDEKKHCSVMGHEALSEAVDDYRRRSNELAEQLNSILKEAPKDLADIVGKGSVMIEHIHPKRVSLKFSGAEADAVSAVLERELLKRTGKVVKVSVTK